MTRSWMFVGLVSAFALAAASPAHAKKVKPAKLTCEEFVGLADDVQPEVVSWLDGYTKGGKPETAVGEVEVEREIAVLAVACKETPNESLLTKIEKHLPGGKQRVKPTQMSCGEYLALESDRQPEVAAWLQGYGYGGAANVEAELDVEQDVVVWVEECKPAPKESIWSRVKKKLH